MPELVKELFYRQYLGTTSIIPSALGYIKFLLRVGILDGLLKEWAHTLIVPFWDLLCYQPIKYCPARQHSIF